MLQYIEEVRQGNERAFEPIVRHFAMMAHAVGYEKLRDVQLAEDAVQEAFTEAYLHIGQLQTPEAFPGWFKAIVERQCYRMLRGKKHPVVPYDDAAQSIASTFSLSDWMERRELKEAVRQSIASLSSNLRIVVRLFYLQGYSLAEISGFLDVSVPTLKKRLFDARQKLKDALPVADLVSVFHHLYEGGAGMLHIVNGDFVAEKLRQGVVKGDILVWREVYPHGPVFTDPVAGDHRALRADYLEKTIGVPRIEFVRGSEEQERTLTACGQYRDIVLWFEHDLFDQTMLVYLLDWFGRQSLPETKIHLLCIGSYPGIPLFRGLGQLSTAQLSELSGTWKMVSKDELALGSAFWQAYTSEDPESLQQLLRTDTSALPFAADAFMTHLAQFPSTLDGLGIVERATLKVLQEGEHSAHGLFKQVGDQLHRLGMGDLQYGYILRRMAEGSHPLIELRGDREMQRPPGQYFSLQNQDVAMTPFAERVLQGEADWVTHNGIDAWYGGVHLQGHRPAWRWDAVERQIVLGE
ncbi:sigma-70 family RNA polymerase sigma factor [Paenibacillus guangzhouensis]|uniref:sigma-70 family RNA polymerase sigma factor n=1 Tax=Paenibacillus guangzhouensis TaxID=1473112 RepID=UPI0012675AE1|nr:sigma-70 family RNA polymerase sigma factor [Paenibacillus guangzhouensis]